MVAVIVVLVHPITKASDIHKLPNIFLSALDEFLSSMHDRNFHQVIIAMLNPSSV